MGVRDSRHGERRGVLRDQRHFVGILGCPAHGNLPVDVRTYAIEVVGLIVGGLAAAPLAGFVARLAPARYLTIAVGLLVLGLAAWQIVRAVKLT